MAPGHTGTCGIDGGIARGSSWVDEGDRSQRSQFGTGGWRWVVLGHHWSRLVPKGWPWQRWDLLLPARDAANSSVCAALLHPAHHSWAIQGRTGTPAALAGHCGLDSISSTWFLWQRQSAVYSAWRRTGYNCRDVVCSVFFQATV